MALTAILFLTVLFAVTALALLRGGREERTVAFALVAAALLTPVVAAHGFEQPEAGVVLVDALLFALLIAVAVRSACFWPTWAAGFQLGALMVHVAAMAVPHMIPAAYIDTLAIWSYAVLFALAGGVLAERTRAL
ncbi:hypothetical protein [Sandaracinobacteroides saxicola]|uniref:Integral membrane protein n=1 Tax=Sandaracinobacteroides saxicola TaxID=2759707 RepID=A0A7G5IJD9_9SPHN|nr:hypothetical protein [Sandaracinobacteroides saxicola]QMW23481.1 hypothetical protein H3309_02970 [Sandaracinobacteroides saxicola]